MENINIEKIYNEETAKYNFYVNNKEVDFIKLYSTLKTDYFKATDNKEKESDFKTNQFIRLSKLQMIFDTMKQSGNEYNCCDYTFRIEEK